MLTLLAQVSATDTPAGSDTAVATPTPPVEPPSVYEQAMDHVKVLEFGELTRDEWITLAEQLGLRAAFVVVLMILAFTLSGWAAGAVRASLRRLKFDETLSLFLAKFTRWGILLLTALACLSKFGVETTSFAAVIGAAGLAIGLAFQGTLSNFAAGAMLLIFRPYKVADVVKIADILGKVHEIELFTTTIDTFDNRRIIVPNSEIYGAVIENITFHSTRRIDVNVGVDYSADIDKTREVLAAAADSVAGLLGEPEPDIILLELGASSVDWSVRGWGPTSDFLGLKQELMRAVKMHLDDAGIGIPYPQMDIHVVSGEGLRNAS